MPVNVRVDVPDFKAEVDLSCDLHDTTFWHLKLCLVDGLLTLYKDARASKQPPPSAVSSNGRERRPLMQLVANTLKGSRVEQDNGHKSESCMFKPATRSTNSIVSTIRRAQQRRHDSVVSSSSRCHSSASSLSLSDKSASSHALEASNISARSSCLNAGSGLKSSSSSSSSSTTTAAATAACYYGFSGVSLADWTDDNARHSNDLSDEEDTAVRAIVMATDDNLNCRYATTSRLDGQSTSGNSNESKQCGSESCQIHDHRSFKRHNSDSSELDKTTITAHDHDDCTNFYECLRFDGSGGKSVCVDSNGIINCDRVGEQQDDRASDDEIAAQSRLFDQLLQSGFLNYGFYSFSLAKFINDQTSLTDYLKTVSSSTGTSYYLDLEFKLKRRQPATSALSKSGIYSAVYDSNANYSQQYAIDSKSSSYNSIRLNNSDAISLQSSRLLNLSCHSSIRRRVDRDTVSSNCSIASQSSHPIQNIQPSFTNNMIAKLASSTSASSQKASSGSNAATVSSTATAAAAPSSASQSKRKRAKLIDLLLSTNWSKQSQHAANLMKLNKVLLVCDANFLDEKTGESPLSLAISSPQINESLVAASRTNRSRSIGNQLISTATSCPQSTSLFDLQSQLSTTSHSPLTLHQTNAIEISQSKGPLVERILLLMIKSGALIDFRNNDGRTPLHIAAKVSNFWALKTLLDLEASPAAIDINGLTPLFYSILHKAELKVTQLLLNHMSSDRRSSGPASHKSQPVDGLVIAGSGCMDIVDQHGWQAIHYAAKYGLSGHLEKLLYYGCDINAKIKGSGNTPLHVAAINDQFQVAKVLLLRGADETITNNSHQTAHQVAVIADNMNLAEFIASHDETKVVPFNASSSHQSNARGISNQTGTNPKILSISSSVHQVAGQTVAPPSSLLSNAQTNKPQIDQQNSGSTQVVQLASDLDQANLFRNSHQSSYQQLHPLTLDVANEYPASILSSAPGTNTSGASHQTAPSLLSIDSSSLRHHGLSGQANNISPSLSQRSCGTSNTTTTSSSGVCCDAGDVGSANHVDSANGRTSNITIISIGNNAGIARETSDANSFNKFQNSNHDHGQRLHRLSDTSGGALPPVAANNISANESTNSSTPADNQRATDDDNHRRQQTSSDGQMNGQDESEEFSGSESSGDGLYSLMSEKKPLFVGSMVKATNCYESGDPKHLQLRRDDLVEILEYPADLVRDGQLPRLANKPMLYGRRLKDEVCGLFPSFCVRRTRHASTRSRRLTQDVTNLTKQHLIAATGNNNNSTPFSNETQQQSFTKPVIRGSGMPESQSMASIGAQLYQPQTTPAGFDKATNNQPNSSGPVATAATAQAYSQQPVAFKEFQVALNKINEGFGFVLRGAKIDPATISDSHERVSKESGKISIDERLMAANRLASLQYFSDIELNSIAHQNGLKRGDFLVSVNGQDVRMCSHEQVVQMIRRSGNQVHLTIARAAPLISGSSKTLSRVKPEPPKRDPTTTLTRNKTARVRSMIVAPQPQQPQGSTFDADKPLPSTPQSGMVASSPLGLNRSVSVNLSHFSSVNSLSSNGLDAQSICSVSTLSSIQAPDTSSSTTTLTTVAANKPQVPPKIDDSHARAYAKINYLPVGQTAYQSDGQSKDQGSSSATAVVVKPTIAAPTIATNKSECPIPPPPPPPLPDFSLTPTKDRLMQRRTSAPINQGSITSHIDRNTLLRKRESLAVISTDSGASVTGSATPICTVAAACAAAANNRLQRQQQQQHQHQQQRQQQGEQHQQESLLSREKEVSRQEKPAIIDRNEVDQSTTPINTPKTVQVNDVNPTQSKEHRVETEPAAHNHAADKPTMNQDAFLAQVHEINNTRDIHSATLGRKSSAQIIQEPKQGGNKAQSQTLKISSAKQRMSILDYDSQVFNDRRGSVNDRFPLQQLYQHNQVDQNHNYHQHQHQHQYQHQHQDQYRLHQHQHQQQQQQQQQQQLLLNQSSQQVLHHGQLNDKKQDAHRVKTNQLQDQHQLLRQQQQKQQQQQLRHMQEQLRLQQQHKCQHGHHNIDYGCQAHVDTQAPVYYQQGEHPTHHHDLKDNVAITPLTQQYQHNQRTEHHHNHHHHSHRLQQHGHHSHHLQQHQNQQQYYNQHYQYSMTRLQDQQHAPTAPPDQHGHHHHQHHHHHHHRMSQYQQQHYLQNVKVDPRLTAMNR